MVRTLVTGGAGFFGSHLVHRLVDAGAEVLTLDALTYAANVASLSSLTAHPRHSLVKADIRDRDAVRAAFTRLRPTVVVHLAAESHVDRSIDDAADFIGTNVVGTWTLLVEAHRYWSRLRADEAAEFRFVLVSTDEVYGSLAPDAPPFDLKSRYDPSSPYAASKAAADHLAQGYFRTYGLPTVISTSCNNYGPRQFPEKLIPLTILNALHRQPIHLYGTGEQVRDWIHVTDHVDAIASVLERGRPGQTYLVSARSERRNLDVVLAVCDLVDELTPGSKGGASRELVRFVEDRPGHDFRYALDPSRTMSELEWSPAHRFEEGLRETVQWYLDHVDWWRPARDAYGGERLGLPRTG